MHIQPEPKPKGCRTVAEWIALFSAYTKNTLHGKFVDIYGSDTSILAKRIPVWRTALQHAAQVFGSDSDVFIVRSAGRINLMGMHIDHRGGSVNTISTGDVIFIVKPRLDNNVLLHNTSSKFPFPRFSIRDELPNRRIHDWDQWTQDEFAERLKAGTSADWSNYVRSAVLYLQSILTNGKGNFDPPIRGMEILVHGALPIAAGLSSSSSLVVGTADAILNVNGIELTQDEFIDLCGTGEWYVGTRGGGGDHAAIKYDACGQIAHIGSYPLTIDLKPFPESHTIVLCNSLRTANKSAGARDFFNELVGCYELGMLLLRKHWPERAPQMNRLRDLQPDLLGVDDRTVLEMIRSLPDPISREDIVAALPEERKLVEKIIGTHAEPPGGYNIRRVCLYGVAECVRSEMAAQRLENRDIEGFGELINISHEGDRVTCLQNGQRQPVDNYLSDKEYDHLIADLRNGDANTAEKALLYRQPGGYNASCEELDEMVDIARKVEGVVGAGLVGAGRGGCIIVIVEKSRASDVIAIVEKDYYQPRGLSPSADICQPTGGSGVLDLD